ncbi:MAG TPA: site-2 protease family protein [Cytophagaceae bacterium]|jgi:membrane-associated protease RseP (regulator of RpoE activity)
MPEHSPKDIAIHVALLVTTIGTTTLAGAGLIGKKIDTIEEIFINGLPFAIPFLLILTVHEYGHYITARIYKVKVSLPFYIPMPPIGIINIGTMGAFIKMKSLLKSTKEIFDIGIAGPLAGFVAAMIILFYGFTHLPPQEYIFEIHPEYKQYGLDYASQVYSKGSMVDSSILVSTGSNLIFAFFENFVVADPSLIPNHYEMMHYPLLFAGYVALFFTALNLLPIGQLDGGHILYGLVGAKRQKIISAGILGVLVFVGGMGLFNKPVLSDGFVPLQSMDDFLTFSPLYLLFLYLVFSKITERKTTNLLIATSMFVLHFLTAYFFPNSEGFSGYLVFSLLVGRFLGVYHPEAYIEEPLDLKRKILGWLSLVIFILCFTPRFLTVE